MTKNNPADKLKEKIFDVLSSDETIRSKLPKMYLEGPQTTIFPYLVMGDCNNTEEENSIRIKLDIHVWSDKPNQLEVKDIIEAVDYTVNTMDLGDISENIIFLRLNSAGIVRQWNEQGSLYRGRLSYAVLIDK